MENPQENNKNEPSFGFKPNYGIVFLLTFIVFLGALLGAYLGSILSLKKNKKLTEIPVEPIKPKPLLNRKYKKVDDEEEEEEESEEDGDDVLSRHKKFREDSITSIRKDREPEN